MSELEKYADQLELKKMIIAMMLSALGFLIAFQWRDVLKETIELFLPPGEGLLYKWIATFIFTLIAATLAIILVKIQKMNIIPDKYEPHKRIAKELEKKLKK
ncbi:MAG: hypothetical protein J7K26_02100 [Candidatus Aenigmarchaeota archaeon]|nr:hypothetical protein [Candidatus Aenigmarchaeota archaeon]